MDDHSLELNETLVQPDTWDDIPRFSNVPEGHYYGKCPKCRPDGPVLIEETAEYTICQNCSSKY